MSIIRIQIWNPQKEIQVPFVILIQKNINIYVFSFYYLLLKVWELSMLCLSRYGFVLFESLVVFFKYSKRCQKLLFKKSLRFPLMSLASLSLSFFPLCLQINDTTAAPTGTAQYCKHNHFNPFVFSNTKKFWEIILLSKI